MGKTKAIQPDLETFTHIPEYSRIIQAYLEPCQASTMVRLAKIFKGYFRNISFSYPLFYEINIINFFSLCLIFIPKVYQM